MLREICKQRIRHRASLNLLKHLKMLDIFLYNMTKCVFWLFLALNCQLVWILFSLKVFCIFSNGFDIPKTYPISVMLQNFKVLIWIVLSLPFNFLFGSLGYTPFRMQSLLKSYRVNYNLLTALLLVKYCAASPRFPFSNFFPIYSVFIN